VLRLARRFFPTRVGSACQFALRGPIRSPRYAHLRPILDTAQDKAGQIPEEPDGDDDGPVRQPLLRHGCSTSRLAETKRKLRDMNAGEMVEAIDAQDETLSISLPFEDRVRLVVDNAYSSLIHAKDTGRIRRAGLRDPHADLRRIELLDERGLDCQLPTQPGPAPSWVGIRRSSCSVPAWGEITSLIDSTSVPAASPGRP